MLQLQAVYAAGIGFLDVVVVVVVVDLVEDLDAEGLAVAIGAEVDVSNAQVVHMAAIGHEHLVQLHESLVQIGEFRWLQQYSGPERFAAMCITLREKTIVAEQIAVNHWQLESAINSVQIARKPIVDRVDRFAQADGVEFHALATGVPLMVATKDDVEGSC